MDSGRRTPRRLRRIAAALVALAALLAIVATAWAAKGELSFREATPPFDLAGASDFVFSPDGKHVYATRGDSLIVLARDAAGGHVSLIEIERDGVDDAGDSGGTVDGIAGASSVAISADGATVYATSSQTDNAIAVFARDAATGRLSFLELEKNGVNDPADPGGTVEGLFRPEQVVVAPDGGGVYVLTDNGGDSLVAFERDASTGRISYLETELEGVDDSGDAGGTVDGILWGTDLAVAPDGEALYATGYAEDSLAVFERNLVTNEISFVEVEKDGVDDTGDAGGTVDGLNGAGAVAVSPDDDRVYVLGPLDSALAVFERDTATEEVSFVEFEKHGIDDAGDAGGTVTGLQSPLDLAVSPESANVYATSRQSDAVAAFRFNASTEDLVFVGATEAQDPKLIAVTPDGSRAYVTGEEASGFGAFTRTAIGAPTFGALEAEFSEQGLRTPLPRGVAVSPDGGHLIVASLSQTVSSISRDAGSGSLTGLADVERNEVDDLSDAGGEVTGLEEPRAVAFSPDGKTVYVTDTSTYGVHVFAFDAVSGELTYLESELEGEDDPEDAGGTVGGLYEPWDVVVSPDGTGLFSLGHSDDALTAFDRDPATGRLSFVESKVDGVGGVDGIAGAHALAISPDSKHVYVAGSESNEEVGAFSRDPATNQLAFIEAEHGGEDDPGDTGPAVEGIGLNVEAAAVSRDGSQVLFAGTEGVTRFERDVATGEISFAQLDSGVEDATALALSVDGRELYVGSTSGNGELAALSLDSASGALALLETEKLGVDDPDDAGPAAAGLQTPEALAISPDDRFLYAASYGEQSIGIFAREGEPSPPPAEAEPIAAPAADTTLSGGVIKAGKRQRQKGKQVVVKLTLRAGEKATGTGWGKVKVGKRSYPLKKLKRSLVAGKALTLKLKPVKAEQRKRIIAALKRGGKATAKLSGQIVDTAGNRLKKSLGVRLTYKRAKRG